MKNFAIFLISLITSGENFSPSLIFSTIILFVAAAKNAINFFFAVLPSSPAAFNASRAFVSISALSISSACVIFSEKVPTAEETLTSFEDSVLGDTGTFFASGFIT